MTATSKQNTLICLLILGILLFFAVLPFGIYGQDGYSLWIPIVAEYLTGDQNFHYSEVIFGGQNIASIYGEFPFWKVLRLFNPSIIAFLNLTHAVFVVLFFILCLTVAKGVKGELKNTDIFVLLTYALLSPAITNRVMAGHFNLLFGILPFFVFTSLIFNKKWPNILFCIFALWCSLSTQAFQVLSYHLFYIPLILFLIYKFEKTKLKYFLLSFAVFTSAFVFNFSNFYEMFQHATGADIMRSIGSKMVYTYTVSQFADLSQFLISGIYTNFMTRSVGFYHEISYPIGAFLLIFVFREKNYRFLLSIIVGFTVLFLFCMNAPIANLLSDIPYLVKPYRTPQRVFMLFSLFVPLWYYINQKNEYKRLDLLIFAFLIALAQLIDYFDLLAFALVLIALLHPKLKNTNLALLVAFSGLYAGSFSKLTSAIESDAMYRQVRNSLLPIQEQFSAEELRKERFHFVTSQPHLVVYVAQSMGISTLEGYGHPPVKILKLFTEQTGINYLSLSNGLYLPINSYEREDILKKLGITKVVTFDSENKASVRSIK